MREPQRGHEREGDGEVTQRHEEYGGDHQSTAERTYARVNLLIVVRGRSIVLDDLSRIADGADLFDEALERHVRRHRDPGALRCVVDRRRDADEVVEPSLDPSGTGSAAHAADGDGGNRFPRW